MLVPVASAPRVELFTAQAGGPSDRAPGDLPLLPLTLGCAICIESCFPEIFEEYEKLDVDCVLVSVMYGDAIRPVIAQAYAALYSYWVGYANPAQRSG